MRGTILIIIFFVQFTLLGQTTLDNSSFEDTPADAIVPHGWFMCNESTTPDILPGFWGVNNIPQDGNTFVGLISRPDGSYEFIGQRLNPSLEKNECYQMSFYAAHSHTYAAYNKVIKVRIWLGEDKCSKDQLIFESEPIDYKEWKKLSIEFSPKAKMKYISIEAYSPKAKRGNVLLDNMSRIIPCGRA